MGEQYVHAYAIQVPVWVVVPILLVVGFGLWKLAKIVWVALSN